MTEHIKCPLCEATAVYKGKELHYWVCEACPFVAFEYYDKRDTDELSSVLNA